VNVATGSGLVVSKTVPAGSYAINAKVQLRNLDDDDEARPICSLFVGESELANIVDSAGEDVLDEMDAVNEGETAALQAVIPNFGGGEIQVGCAGNRGAGRRG
jgi:hypothetical protein